MRFLFLDSISAQLRALWETRGWGLLSDPAAASLANSTPIILFSLTAPSQADKWTSLSSSSSLPEWAHPLTPIRASSEKSSFLYGSTTVSLTYFCVSMAWSQILMRQLISHCHNSSAPLSLPPQAPVGQSVHLSGCWEIDYLWPHHPSTPLLRQLFGQPLWAGSVLDLCNVVRSSSFE